MPTCAGGNTCGLSPEAAVSWEAAQIQGSFKIFIETFSFLIFIFGVALNTCVMTILISAWPNLDKFDGYMMNIAFGDLISSFSLAFVFFVQFTTSLAPIGDGGCKFITWLDVTSVTITSIALIVAVHELKQCICYPNQESVTRKKFLVIIISTWLIASLPGLPYMVTAYMGDNKVCMMGNWSDESGIIFTVMLLVIQVMVPVGILVYLFTRIYLGMSSAREGDAALEDEAAPGSEASLILNVFRRKATLLVSISSLFFAILTLVSMLELSLALDIGMLSKNTKKYARMRTFNELLLCAKCIANPLFAICHYDKFRMYFKKLCCCRRNQDIYNTLNLRYNVYQQTVQDQTVAGNRQSAISQEDEADEVFETERDDVAILET